MGSLEVIPTVSFVLTKFQLASTALTVTLNAAQPVCALGVAAVLPVAVPGAATSPGNRICSLTTGPGLTMMAVPVLVPMPGWVTSLAVTVWLPDVFMVTLMLSVPPTNAALAGSTAF